jgi:hypothetical protein
MVIFWIATPIGLVGGTSCLEQKVEAVCSSGLLVSTYKSIHHHSPEDYHGHHCCENLKSHIFCFFLRDISCMSPVLPVNCMKKNSLFHDQKLIDGYNFYANLHVMVT